MAPNSGPALCAIAKVAVKPVLLTAVIATVSCVLIPASTVSSSPGCKLQLWPWLSPEMLPVLMVFTPAAIAPGTLIRYPKPAI